MALSKCVPYSNLPELMRIIGPVDKQRHSSPQTSKGSRVRKLQPLDSVTPNKLVHTRPRVDVLQHVRSEVDRLQKLMTAAVATRDLKQVGAIMEQLIGFVERSDSTESRGGWRTDEEKAFYGDLIAYLETSEADLRALAQQEEHERQHQRLVANGLMKQAVALLHSGAAVEISAVEMLLDRAERAYRRARDKRAACIPAIRYKAVAEARLAEASRLFDAGDISAAIETARSASDQYAAFRTSPMYHGSQMLLSLSEPVDPLGEIPLRELGHSHDDLDKCFADVEGFFQEKAQAKTKLLLAESKRLADERCFAKARDAMARCCEVYKWLAEPVPVAAAKWGRQLERLELARELKVVEEATRDRNARREVTAQVLKWVIDFEAGRVDRDDFVECGVARFALLSITTLSPLETEDLSTRDLATAVFKFCSSIFRLDTASNAANALINQVADTKTVVTFCIRLAELLDGLPGRVRVLLLLVDVLDSKQAAHVAIHKCGILPSWKRLREANSSMPEVLVVLLNVLLHLITPSFSVFAPIFVQENMGQAVVSTFARHYKHAKVAGECLEIISTCTRSREHCLAAISPNTSGLSGAVAQALRYYTQQQPAQGKPLVVNLAVIVRSFCELDVTFAKAISAAKLPVLISSLGIKHPWQISTDLVDFFEPQQFDRFVRDGGFPLKPELDQTPTRIVLPLPLHSATNQPDLLRVCVAKFGASAKTAGRRQFYVVRFLVPDDPATAFHADKCRLEVIHVNARAIVVVYAFPPSGLYSVSMLRRELTGPVEARDRLFRTLLTSLQPLKREATLKSHMSQNSIS